MRVRSSVVISVVGFAVLLSTFAAQSSFASVSNWPATIHAREWTGVKNVVGPEHRGELVPSSVLNAEGGIQSPKYKGQLGWATVTIRGYLYPVVSTNHGTTWRVGGIYFARTDSEARYYVSKIRIMTSQVVAIYAPNDETFDITSNGGRTWYQTFFPGLIQSISSGASKSQSVTEGTIDVNVKSSPDSAARNGTYSSANSGRTWTSNT